MGFVKSWLKLDISLSQVKRLDVFEEKKRMYMLITDMKEVLTIDCFEPSLSFDASNCLMCFCYKQMRIFCCGRKVIKVVETG